MKYSISTIVPSYNEEANIGNTVEKLVEFFQPRQWPYEIIIVDSHSRDKTPAIADALSKKYPAVRVIHQPVRLGVGNGLREGYAASRYDLVWYMDADYPYEVADVLPQAISLMDRYDAVSGYRVGKKESLLRVVSSCSYSFLINVLFGLNVRNCNFSFKLVKRSALSRLDLRSDGWFIDSELLLELRKKGFSLTQIPVPFLRRTKGQSKVKIFPTAIGLLREMVRYCRRENASPDRKTSP